MDELESFDISPNCKRSAIFHVDSKKRKNLLKMLKATIGIYEIFAVLPDKRSHS